MFFDHGLSGSDLFFRANQIVYQDTKVTRDFTIAKAANWFLPDKSLSMECIIDNCITYLLLESLMPCFIPQIINIEDSLNFVNSLHLFVQCV